MKSPKTISKALALTVLVSLSAQTSYAFDYKASFANRKTKIANSLRNGYNIAKNGYDVAAKYIVNTYNDKNYGKAKLAGAAAVGAGALVGGAYGLKKLFSPKKENKKQETAKDSKEGILSKSAKVIWDHKWKTLLALCTACTAGAGYKYSSTLNPIVQSAATTLYNTVKAFCWIPMLTNLINATNETARFNNSVKALGKTAKQGIDRTKKTFSAKRKHKETAQLPEDNKKITQVAGIQTEKIAQSPEDNKKENPIRVNLKANEIDNSIKTIMTENKSVVTPKKQQLTEVIEIEEKPLPETQREETAQLPKIVRKNTSGPVKPIYKVNSKRNYRKIAKQIRKSTRTIKAINKNKKVNSKRNYKKIAKTK